MNQFAKPGLAEEKLPPVSSADNGKVLGVNNGVWEKVAASGGTTVVANPTIAGTEADLTGLQVGDTKYKIPEGGGGGGVLVIGADLETYTLDKTWQEIADADFPIIRLSDGGQVGASWNTIMEAVDKGPSFPERYVVKMVQIGINNETHECEVYVYEFSCASENGYPAMQMGG